MSFGRNPHVAKAEAAELKAQTARDASAWEQAWREAARQWDRAAERENDAKKRAQFEERAATARATAESPRATAETPRDTDPDVAKDPSLLN